MGNFKVGDVVICVDPCPHPYPRYLKYGGVYVVSHRMTRNYNEHFYIKVEGHPNTMRESRFELSKSTIFNDLIDAFYEL